MATPLFPPKPLKLQLKGGEICSHARKEWPVQTPEETVRQQYLLTLVNEYGYALNRITEEESPISGRGSVGARFGDNDAPSRAVASTYFCWPLLTTYLI